MGEENIIMKKALIVGINEYPNAPLKGCVNDAEDIAKILECNGDNSPNFEVKKELNVAEKGKLKGLIKECFSGDNEIALFYYSGHGFIDSIGGYIVTPDYSNEDMGVSMQDVLIIANESKCRNKVVILDCCHAGFMGNTSMSGQSAATIQEGVTILTASKSTESALEIGGHGLFTSLLLEALNGGAADITGHITPGGIYAYIDNALGAWDQRPVFKTNVTRFSPLRRVKPQVDSAILRKIVDYFSDPKQECRLDPSFEPTNTDEVEHNVIEPYANEANVAIFKELQKMESVGLVVPCGEEHMYFAAMHSKSCKLTAIGQHYWRLVKNKKL
jgi:uncharacterized caspase-like protein